MRPPVTVEEGWKERDPQLTTQAPPDTTWWRAFSDSTLDRLVEMAYHQNLTLQVAGLRIMEARARLGNARGRKWPQVQAAVGSATAVGISDHAANSAFIDRHYWDYQAGFDAAWELDLWGKYGSDVNAEQASYLASIADYDDALVSLAAEIARTYAEIRTFEVLVQQAQTNADLQAEGLRIAQSRFRHGATSELDVAQATTLLQSTRRTIPELQIGLQQTQNALCTLLGQPTSAITALLGGPSQGIPAAPPQVSVSVPAEMLRRRPDIRSAELNAVAQCDRIGVARADLYPSFSLFGTVGTQTSSGGGLPSGGSTFSDIFGPGSLFYAVGPRLLWPLFNYSRIQNNVRVQDARLQQLLVDYRSTVLRAAQEVDDGAVGYLRSQEATAFADSAAKAARRSVDLALVQYREGAVDYQRVIDAERSLLLEENNLAQSRSSVATSLVALYKALGGGWEIRQGQPFVPDSTRIEMQDRTNWGDYFSKPPATKTQSGSAPNSR